MYQPGYVAEPCGRLNEPMNGFARRDIHGRDAHLVSGVSQDLCRRIDALRAHVGEQYMLPDANPARDCLADVTSSDQDNVIFHSCSSRLHGLSPREGAVLFVADML